MKPLVSVIVPLYNMEQFVVETLESIIKTTYPNYEIIVMNDGSTDHSRQVAEMFAAAHTDINIKIYNQQNQGASVARNNAINISTGKYILPVDADDLVDSRYIPLAVEILEQQSEVLVVGCEIEMFGLQSKKIHYPPFSLELLARKNMIAAPSMFRRSDWERAGGYCPQIKGREDWDFWLSVFANGGQFLRLPITGIYYRVHNNSKRLKTQKYKHQLIDQLNLRHSAYMERYLGGPLHYHRSLSKLLNCFRSVRQIGDFNHWIDGEVIFNKRNTIRCVNNTIVKQFAIPSLWRGILYGMLCKSKAKRSYEYAKRLHNLTPTPIAYREVRICGVLRESWYACKKSHCAYTFNELIKNTDFPNREIILQAIGSFTAQLHKQGILHQDYSGGNILFNEDGSLVQVIDLNRVRFCKHLTREQRLKNFERFNIDRKALTTMAIEYAKNMGEDAVFDTEYIIAHRWHKHIKQGITNL